MESVNAKSLASERNRRRRGREGSDAGDFVETFLFFLKGEKICMSRLLLFLLFDSFFFHVGWNWRALQLYIEKRDDIVFSSDKRRHSAHPAPSSKPPLSDLFLFSWPFLSFFFFLFRWRIVVVVGWHAPINCLLQLEPFTWPIYLEWDATGAMGVDGQTKKMKKT